jgi:Domain of unknown function (DUF6457)
MDWLDQLAAALGLDPPTSEETAQVLDVARDVAHRVERRITPLSTLLLGMSIERRMATGATRSESIARAVEDLRSVLPPAAEEDHPAGRG